jgi:hypothetical protein
MEILKDLMIISNDDDDDDELWAYSLRKLFTGPRFCVHVCVLHINKLNAAKASLFVMQYTSGSI